MGPKKEVDTERGKRFHVNVKEWSNREYDRTNDKLDWEKQGEGLN